MHHLFYKLFLLILVLSIGCSGDDSTSGNDRATLQLFLTDLPLEAKEVWITFSQIEVHQTGGGWQTFEDDEQEIDLLTLQDTQELLALGPLTEGKYTGIRFLISAGHVIDLEDQRCDLTVPSNKIHVPVNFDIDEEGATSVLLDFDAEQSVHIVSRGNNESCILRPVIKPVSVD